MTRLRAIAEAAVGEWVNVGVAVTGTPSFVAPDEVGEHIATWSPSVALRVCDWAEEVLRRHAPVVGNPRGCWRGSGAGRADAGPAVMSAAVAALAALAAEHTVVAG